MKKFSVYFLSLTINLALFAAGAPSPTPTPSPEPSPVPTPNPIPTPTPTPTPNPTDKTYILRVLSGSGSGEYLAQQTVSVTANQAQAGRVFSSWIGNGAVYLADASQSQTTLTMPNKSIILLAKYEAETSNPPAPVPVPTPVPTPTPTPVDPPEIQEYTVNIIAGSGDGSYQANQSVRIQAEDRSPQGFLFERWIGADSSLVQDIFSATSSFVMPARSVQLQAQFEAVPQDQSPYNGVAQSIPGIIEAEDYDRGGEGVAFSDKDNNNQGRHYRSEGVDINSISNGAAVGYTQAGEWLEYTINVQEDNEYSLSMNYAALKGGGSFSIEIDGETVHSESSVKATNSWTNYRKQSLSSLELKAGEQVLRIVFNKNTSDGYVLDLDYLEIVEKTSVINEGYNLPGRFEAEDYDLGGEGLAYLDSDPQNFGNANYRTGEGVDIYQVGEVKALGRTRVGEEVNYTVNVEKSQRYDLYARIAVPNAGGVVQVLDQNNSLLVQSRAISSTGAWTQYQVQKLGSLDLNAGKQVITLKMIESANNNENVADFDYFEILPYQEEPETPVAGPSTELYPMTGLIWMEARSAQTFSGLVNPVIMALSGKAKNARNYKIIHPWYNPYKSPMNESQVRSMVNRAICSEGYEGVGLDNEGWTIFKGPEMLRWMHEEAKKCGGYFINVPKITLDHHAAYKIWNGERDFSSHRDPAFLNLDQATKDRYNRKVIEWFEKYTDASSGWIYLFDGSDYYKLSQYWKSLGYTKQMWPMGDSGYRPSYGGINTTTATATVNFLADRGISFGLFNPKTGSGALSAMEKRLRGQQQ